MRTIICTLFMSLLSITGFAQNEPEFEMEPYVFNCADSTFETSLPCESAYIKAKVGASLFLVGVGKVKIWRELCRYQYGKFGTWRVLSCYHKHDD